MSFEIIQVRGRFIENPEVVDSDNNVAFCRQLPDGRCRWKVIRRQFDDIIERFFEKPEEACEELRVPQYSI